MKKKSNMWKDFNKEKPQVDVEIIAYNSKWIDEDFNPNGTRIGFLTCEGYFISAYWWDEKDDYIAIDKSKCDSNPYFFEHHLKYTEPEFWTEIPKFNKDK